MTKNEFMIKLQEALENDLDASAVRDNVNYYSNYIDDEIRKGRSEEEVLDELGDPWVIAQSVIDMSAQKNVTEWITVQLSKCRKIVRTSGEFL